MMDPSIIFYRPSGMLSTPEIEYDELTARRTLGCARWYSVSATFQLSSVVASANTSSSGI